MVNFNRWWYDNGMMVTVSWKQTFKYKQGKFYYEKQNKLKLNEATQTVSPSHSMVHYEIKFHQPFFFHKKKTWVKCWFGTHFSCTAPLLLPRHWTAFRAGPHLFLTFSCIRLFWLKEDSKGLGWAITQSGLSASGNGCVHRTLFSVFVLYLTQVTGYLVLLYFITLHKYIFYKLKVCGNPTSGKSMAPVSQQRLLSVCVTFRWFSRFRLGHCCRVWSGALWWTITARWRPRWWRALSAIVFFNQGVHIVSSDIMLKLPPCSVNTTYLHLSWQSMLTLAVLWSQTHGISEVCLSNLYTHII